MKKNNPHTPIMVREAAGVEPKVYARYGAPSLVAEVEAILTCILRVWQGEVGAALRHVRFRLAGFT